MINSIFGISFFIFGNVTTYSYDDQDRLIKQVSGEGEKSETLEYIYDEYGRLTDVKTEDSHISYHYNSYGELYEKCYENGQRITYLYDGYGRSAGNKVYQNDTLISSTKYEFDTMNRITRVYGHDGTAVVYTYDENGNCETATYANGITLTYTYDECNRLTLQKVVDKEGNVLAQYTYILSEGGEREQVIEEGPEGRIETSYEYDKAGRLTKETIETEEKTTEYEYTYDVMGNRIEKVVDGVLTTYAYGYDNELISETTNGFAKGYSYDGAGNLISSPADNNGTYKYTYDSLNRMISRLEVRTGDTETYTYDAEGVRRSKTTTTKTETGDTVTETVYYISDTSGSLSQTLAEVDEAGNVVASYTRGDVLISQNRDKNISYYLMDGHGDVRALTDNEGNITDTYRYDAYGNLIAREGTTKNHYLYTGEYLDSTTGYYYLRARYMDPTTGMFTSRDTYEGSIYDPDTLHKYLYANGNPVKYTDPSVHMAELVARMYSEADLQATQLEYDTVMLAIAAQLYVNLFWSCVVMSMADNPIYLIEGILETENVLASMVAVVDTTTEEIVAYKKSDDDIKGEYTVYTLVDEEGNVRYVGRAKDYEKRMSQHEQPGGKMEQYDLKRGVHYDDLTYEQARGLEQSLMLFYHTLNATKDATNSNVNFINGVGVNNPNAETYYNKAIDYINKYPSYFENQLDNEIDNLLDDINYWWR